MIFFYYKGGKTLEQVAQKSGRCHIIGKVQGQVGWSFEKLDLVDDAPGHSS